MKTLLILPAFLKFNKAKNSREILKVINIEVIGSILFTASDINMKDNADTKQKNNAPLLLFFNLNKPYTS